MRASLRLLLPLLATSAALAGCDSEDGPVICPAVRRPALVLTVTDSLSGEPRALGVSGYVLAGSRLVPLEPENPGEPARLVAFGPAGTYSVLVRREGYLPWARSEVRVATDNCGPATVELAVRLQPAAVSLLDGAR